MYKYSSFLPDCTYFKLFVETLGLSVYQDIGEWINVFRLIHTASPLIQGPRGVMADTFLLVHNEDSLN